MSADPDTLACYARMAGEYARKTSRAKPDDDLRAFMAALPEGAAPVLDWGCGPGNSAAMMNAAGVTAEATDASPEMVAMARDAGVVARVEPFETLEATARYRGIWANFSLLHAAPGAVPGLIGRAARALVPGGVLHLGMKTGIGTSRDNLGRFYSYWDEDRLDHMTARAGLAKLSARHGTASGLSGRVEPFVIHLSRKSAGD